MNHLAVRTTRPTHSIAFRSNVSLNGAHDAWEEEWEEGFGEGIAMSNRDRKVPAKLRESRSAPRRMDAWN